MNTEERMELFSAHLDGFLSPKEEEFLSQYLEDNPAYREELEQLKALSQSFRDLPEEPLPSGFKAELHKRLVEVSAPKAKKKGFWQSPWLKGVAAFAAFILVVGFANSNLASSFLNTSDSITGNSTKGASPEEYSGDIAIMENSYGGGFDGTSAPADLGEMSIQKEMSMPRSTGSGAPLNFERRIIRNAYLTVETEDYTITFDAIIALADKYGGYVVSSYTNNYQDGTPSSGNVSIRVVSDKMEEALEEIRPLGKIRDENISGNDITPQYYDTQSRLNQYQVQKERLLELYEKAENISELIQIEGELSRINMEIDVLEGQLRYYTELTDLSSIEVHLIVPREYREKISIDGWQGLGRKIVVALISGVNLVLNATAKAFLFIIAILPVLLILFIFFLVVKGLWKRRNTNK